MVVWHEWLPEHIAEAVNRDEPLRFAALSHALEAEWRAQDPSAPDHAHLVKWVSIINQFFAAKANFDIGDIDRLVKVALEIILNSNIDVVAQVRWATCTAKFLRRYRRALSLEIPWRALYNLLRTLHFENSTSYQGAAVMESHREALINLIRKSRRFFPPGSAAEIWAEFRGGLEDTHQPAAFEALGWITLLMPTLAAGRGDGDWNEWVSVWLTTWGRVIHNSYWDCLWLALVGRLVKHDTLGLVAWYRHLDVIYTNILWIFHVPVGTSSASIPISRPAPQECETLFGGECAPKGQSAAKIIVYLLGRCSEPDQHIITVATEDSIASPVMGTAESVREEVDDGVTARLDRLVDLLEQYFHPSNGGRWTASLSRFMRNLMDFFSRRLMLDAALRDQQQTVPASATARSPMSAHVQRRFVRALLRMAGRAQYSKDNGLMDTACGVLSAAAYIAPDLVLPLVHQRFEKAFETVTAAHLLVTAIHTLGLCARPLLLAGLRVAHDVGEPTPAWEINRRPEHGDFESAREVVAAAMMATLPGIDANDPPKTLACYRLYCGVLSATGGFAGAAETAILPLYTEEWVEELLSRTFAVFSNLDSTDLSVGAQDTAATAATAANDMRGSFLLLGTSMFRPLMELLFSRLPAELQAAAIRRVGRFLVTTTLPSVTAEGSVMCNAATCANPAVAATEILSPLLDAAIEELPSQSASTRSAHISRAVEGTLLWRLGLIASSLYHLGPAALPLVPKLRVVIDRGMALVDSPRVQEVSARVLTAVLGTIISYFPTNQYAPPTELLEPAMLEMWVNSNSTAQRPIWHIPSPAEMEAAHVLVSAYLEAPIEGMHALCTEGSAGSVHSKKEKDELRRLLMVVEAVLHGLRICLPDFEWGPPGGEAGMEVEATSLRVAGELGCAMPLLTGTREKLAMVLFDAFKWINEQDSDSRKAVLRVVNIIMSIGTNEHNDANQSMGAWRTDEQALSEGAVGGELHTGVLEGMTAENWKRHRPRWLTIERCYLHGLWRASQAAYRPWLSTTCLEPTLSMVPPAYRQLFTMLIACCTDSYKTVRETATSVLERSLKRIPCLVPMALSPMLLAVAGVQSESNGDGLMAPNSLEQVVQQLAEEADTRSAAAVTTDAEASSNGAAEEQRMEAMALGACAVLRGRACWRLMGRSPLALSATMRALYLSSQHTSLRSQAAINDVFLIFTLRFIRPPPLISTQAGVEILPSGIASLAEDLLAVASSGASKLHWRYDLTVNTFLLFLLPMWDVERAGRMFAHSLSLLTGQILPLRQLALVAASFQVSTLSSDDQDSPLREVLHRAVTSALSAPNYASDLLSHMAHNHVALMTAEAGSDGQRSRNWSSIRREEAVVKSISATLNRFQEWPVMRKRPTAMKGGQFVMLHVRSMTKLFTIAPQLWAEALAGPLAEALKDQSNLAEKTTACAAAEVIAGLVASEAAFCCAPGQPSAWEGWLKQLLRGSLANCPLELAEMWGLVVRYGVGGLINSEDDTRLAALLEIVAEPSEPGAPSSAVVKHLKAVSNALGELLTQGQNSRPEARAFHATVLQELLRLMATPLNSVRREVAKCISYLAASRDTYGASEPTGTESEGGTEEGTYAENLAVEVAAARGDGSACLPLRARIQRLQSHLVSSLVDGVPYVLMNSVTAEGGRQQAQDVVMGEVGEERVEVDGGEREGAVARLGSAVQFVIRSMRSGDAGYVADTLLACLEPLLSVQEMPDPELQPLAMEAKTAFALLKYLPMHTGDVGRVLGVLLGAQEKEPWHARAAALVFTQYFWFRQVYVLDGAEYMGILENVVALLSDRKLEVQELAAATLSGILRGAPASEGAALRGRFVEGARGVRATSSRGRRGRTGAGLTTSDSTATLDALAKRHAPVMGLKGFVLSTPYDVPRWLPEVLMSLVSVSGEPPPIKTTVARSLGEFRRTHEEVGLQECRDYFDAEQWEAIQDVTSTASYYV